ncbi:MAG TPA: 2-(1,2-epoxy-1,2-dihydrophenyl)acetyl-CoA isomerase [Flavobacteriales bacterium]|nr:2-(1,2-epoxy-1,2-dihydrophenyl)acetyl-CoA isomerase [Flavobacteriales bacterium]|tara:strand:- start:101820 stop:102599 length:780 start_codon:yes stop_codon:yes gene_type:complete
MENYIITELKDNIAYIQLNRPEKFNSFIRPMALALQDFIKEQANNEKVRCFYVTGNGKAFCAGQDLAEAIDPNGPELTKIVEEHYNPIIQLIRNTEKPFIAAVNGVAAGAGANIALACDIVVATKSASFIQAFSKIGLIPDSGGTYILPRLIGWQKASALMMTGDKVSAEEAEKMGMIYKWFDDESFEEEAKKLAIKIANMPTKGLGLTKKLLNKSFTTTLNEQLDLENEYQTIAGQTYDYQEGVNAFLEKRKPEFKGI